MNLFIYLSIYLFILFIQVNLYIYVCTSHNQAKFSAEKITNEQLKFMCVFIYVHIGLKILSGKRVSIIIDISTGMYHIFFIDL